VDVPGAAGSGGEGGPGEVGVVEMVLGAGAVAERSGVRAGSIAGDWGRSWSSKLSDCSVNGEVVGVGLGGGGERAGGGV
jgi:hypothetical protein